MVSSLNQLLANSRQSGILGGRGEVEMYALVGDLEHFYKISPTNALADKLQYFHGWGKDIFLCVRILSGKRHLITFDDSVCSNDAGSSLC